MENMYLGDKAMSRCKGGSVMAAVRCSWELFDPPVLLAEQMSACLLSSPLPESWTHSMPMLIHSTPHGIEPLGSRKAHLTDWGLFSPLMPQTSTTNIRKGFRKKRAGLSSGGLPIFEIKFFLIFCPALPSTLLCHLLSGYNLKSGYKLALVEVFL